MEIEKTKQKENKLGKYFLSIIMSILLIGIASAQTTSSSIVTSSICPIVSSFGGFGVFQLVGVSVVLFIGGWALFATYKRQVKDASEKDTPMNFDTMIEIVIGMVAIIMLIYGGIAYYQGSLHCPAT